MKILVLLLALLLSSPVWAIVAYDTTTTAQGSGITSLTWSHTITGANVTLVATACWSPIAAFASTVNSIAYNSVNLTAAGTIRNASEYTEAVTKYAIAPATGAHNVVITMDDTANIVGMATSYTGAHQTTPVSNVTTGVDLSAGVNVTVPTNGLTQDFACTIDTTLSVASGGQTFRASNTLGGGTEVMGATSTRSTTGSFTWSGSLSTSYDSQLGLAINETAATTAARRRIITDQ